MFETIGIITVIYFGLDVISVVILAFLLRENGGILGVTRKALSMAGISDISLVVVGLLANYLVAFPNLIATLVVFIATNLTDRF